MIAPTAPVTCDPDASLTSDLNLKLKAVGLPVRRDILKWLDDPQTHFPNQSYGQNLGVCVGQIVSKCRLSQSTISAHLSALEGCGLITVTKVGKVRFLKRNEAEISRFLLKLAQSLSA